MLVGDEADGDLAVAFEGFEWHTHGGLLVPSYGAAGAEAVTAFVGRILADQLVIAVCRRRGVIHDVRITDDPAAEPAYASEGEQISLRLWSGRAWHAANPPMKLTVASGARSLPARQAATGGATMAQIPEWHVAGDWFDVCKCSIPCPCTFAQAPSSGDCDGVLA